MGLNASKPLFISVEGVDGCGKSTQLRRLARWLSDEGIAAITTREPGGCPAAEELRNLLLTGEHDKWDGLSELFLFSAARHEHVRQIIEPALCDNKWVLSDRFADSTRVFQGIARGIDEQDIQTVTNLAVGDCWPDLTLIFDIDPAEGLRRKNSQFARGLDESRMESLGLSFQRKVRDGFKKIADEEPQRCRIIDASGSFDDVFNQIQSIVTDFAGKAAA